MIIVIPREDTNKNSYSFVMYSRFFFGLGVYNLVGKYQQSISTWLNT